MISKFFVTRPIFAAVVSAFIVLAGLGALRALPIAQFPDILPPQVIVTANYPGATAETVADTVAAPLEAQINGVERMLYVTSVASGDGSLQLTVTFVTGTDPDLATINVNNRVQAALPRLPEEVRRQGVTVLKSSTSFLEIVTLSSTDDRYDGVFLSNYALLNVMDELKRIPGVGDVQNFAGSIYAMRIWLQPDKLAKLGITPQDVASAVREQNSQFAAGRTGREPVSDKVDFSFAVTAQGRFSEPEQFENIIVRTNSAGTIVRLKDIARIELGGQSYDFAARYNRHVCIPMAIILQPGANALAVGDAVKARLEELKAGFPAGMVYGTPYDTTDFVRVSIREVIKTLVEAMVLVFIVVFVFLQNWRATLIPMLAVPVSLIGTLAGMYLLGFSINTLTLFGMVLSIGIVVDDAIVVLENVERIMATENLSPRAATVKAMQEVTGPIIAIVLVLTAVFVPVAFLGGLVGELYRQFAITIALSVFISGFVALSLTPALCALVLRPEDVTEHHFAQRFTDWFVRMTGRYTTGVRFVAKHRFIALGVFGAMVLATVGLYRYAPATLVPDEDLGFVAFATVLPDAASLSRTIRATDRVNKTVLDNPNVVATVAMTGIDIVSNATHSNVSAMFVALKDWKDRDKSGSPQAIIGVGMSTPLDDGVVFGFAPPPIIGLSNTGGFNAYLQSRSGASSAELQEVVQKFIAAASQRKELSGVGTSFSASVPQVRVDLDREKTRALGVSVSDVFDTLQSTFGAYYINDFNRDGRVFQVLMQSEPRFRQHPEDIRDVYLRSATGQIVPLTALVNLTQINGPEVVQRFNVFPAADLIGGPAQGYSSGQAIKAMEETAAKVLPAGYSLAWSGSYLQEKLSGTSSGTMFILGILMAFMVLSALYERVSLPIAVILAVPFAAFGALLAVWLRGLGNDIYFQIGMITLIGLSAKNAVLIVEFAIYRWREGVEPFEAAVEAARLRFRPIVMTSLAFILGVMPLAVSTGAGANGRHSIGTGVIGGMLAATFIATFFIPMFFAAIARRIKAPPKHDD
jgi:multidrug efflux pump